MVYHTMVKSIARRNFERVNQRDYNALLKDCVPQVKHRFGGSHALGGERNNKVALEKWFQRLFVCAPGLKLTVTDVWVKGWPWNTTIIIRWTATDTFPDGSPYNNHGVHVVNMKWGYIYSIDANEDSQAVASMLKQRFDAGLQEAGEPPILS